jgi:hypothetical protein
VKFTIKMKQDIEFPNVEGVKIAIVKDINELNETTWVVYLLNRNDIALSNVFVTSKGYGEKDGEEQKTSVLRYSYEEVAANEIQLIELIFPDVFHLNNEYWVSYSIGRKMYDKKFIFLPDSITDAHLIEIVPLGKMGILHE